MKLRKVLLLAFGCLVALPALSQLKVPPGNPPSSYNPSFSYPALADTGKIDSIVQVRQDNLAYTKSKVDNTNAQAKANAYAIEGERVFEIWEILKNQNGHPDSVISKRLITNVVTISRDGQITKMDTEKDTAFLYLSGYSDKKFVATMTWHTNSLYDTTFVTKETVDDPSTQPARYTIGNMALARTTDKPGVYNKSFSFVNVTSSPSFVEFGFTGDVIQFGGERWNGHGNITIFIDGQQKAVLFQGAQPWTTDFVRLQPSFSYTFPKAPAWNSPPTAHKIRIETTAGNQYIIDFMRIVNYTLSVHNAHPPIQSSTPKKKK